MLLFSCLVIFSFIFFYRREGTYYGCIFSLLFDELVFIICFTTQISTLTIDELGKARIFASWFFHYKNIVNLTHTWERIETISYSGLVKWPYRIHKPLLNRFT